MLALIGSIVWAVYTAHETNRTFVEDHQEPYRASILDHIPTTNVETCSRKIPPSVSYYPGNRTYHAFDDVLLVVFFSHARYDANLDYYREVYSEFFPNVGVSPLICGYLLLILGPDSLRRTWKPTGCWFRPFI